MDKKFNANYELIDSISIAGNTYVLGENPKAPSPYATWSKDPNGGYSFGHYFTDLAAARADLFKRGMSHLPEESYDQLFRDNLPDHIREEIVREERESGFFADIENCLYDAVEHLGGESADVEELMKNEDFRGLALHTYFKQDHSYENEALSDSLETLVRDKFMHVLAFEQTTALNTSPERLRDIPLAEKLKQAEAEAAKNNEGSPAKANPEPQL